MNAHGFNVILSFQVFYHAPHISTSLVQFHNSVASLRNISSQKKARSGTFHFNCKYNWPLTSSKVYSMHLTELLEHQLVWSTSSAPEKVTLVINKWRKYIFKSVPGIICPTGKHNTVTVTMLLKFYLHH